MKSDIFHFHYNDILYIVYATLDFPFVELNILGSDLNFFSSNCTIESPIGIELSNFPQLIEEAFFNNNEGKYTFKIEDYHFMMILDYEDELKMILLDIVLEKEEEKEENKELKSMDSLETVPCINNNFNNNINNNNNNINNSLLQSRRKLLVEKLFLFQLNKIKELESINFILKEKASQRDEALNQVSLAIREKNDLERESYSKFIKLLNAKKERIRLLDNEVKRVTLEKFKLIQKVNNLESKLQEERDEKRLICREAKKLEEELQKLEYIQEENNQTLKIFKDHENRKNIDDSYRKRTGKNDESPVASTMIHSNIFKSPIKIPEKMLLVETSKKQFRNPLNLNTGDLLDMLEDI